MVISSAHMYKQISPGDFKETNKILLEIQATLIRLQRRTSNYKEDLKESKKLKTKMKIGYSALKKEVDELESFFPKEKKVGKKIIKGKKLTQEKSLTKKIRTRKEPVDPLDKELDDIQRRLNTLG